VPPAWIGWFNPAIGTIGGILAGLTGFFGPIVVPYLVALRLHKDEFVATVSLIYLCGSIALYISLWESRVLTQDEFVASLLASLPTLAGVGLGTWLRGRIRQEIFQKLLVVLLFVAGANLIRRALF
jgi:uncharacterized membrane protein YfcA